MSLYALHDQSGLLADYQDSLAQQRKLVHAHLEQFRLIPANGQYEICLLVPENKQITPSFDDSFCNRWLVCFNKVQMMEFVVDYKQMSIRLAKR